MVANTAAGLVGGTGGMPGGKISAYFVSAVTSYYEWLIGLTWSIARNAGQHFLPGIIEYFSGGRLV